MKAQQPRPVAMSKKNKNDLGSLEQRMQATAKSAPMLIFMEFECPFCEELNVMAKSLSSEYVLCSNSSCRRVIQIKNHDEVA
tara:strand:+ start:12270 stop:12515 length:246 start_codon:yes stop_codon:yes gene_type:complete